MTHCREDRFLTEKSDLFELLLIISFLLDLMSATGGSVSMQTDRNRLYQNRLHILLTQNNRLDNPGPGSILTGSTVGT